MTPKQTANFKNDLKKAQQTIHLLDTLPEHGPRACLDAAKAVYDKGLPPGKTNLIFIDALDKEYEDKFVLLHVLLKELGQDLEQFNKIQSGVMLAKSLLSGGYSVAGLFSGGATGGFDLLMDKPLDYMLEKLADIVSGKVVDNGADAAAEKAKSLGSKLSDYRLNLSETAKQSFIEKTLSKFDSDLSLGEIFNLTETLLLNCSIAEADSEKSEHFYGKLLIIQDPASLDTITLSLLNHLLAVCKDQSNLPFNFSILNLRTQPDPKEGAAFDMLTNQRTFALRYGMYETPDADYPNRLITPDLFVGRLQELAILHDQAKAFYETHAPENDFNLVVLGEPGMGKTRLVEKHQQQFRKHLAGNQEKAKEKAEQEILNKQVMQEIFTVKLTLYCDNQLSSDSGLSSLISSLEKEIDRFGAAHEEYVTFFERRLSKIKDLLRKPKGLLSKSKELIPLYKDFQAIKESLHKFRKGTADSVQQKSEQSLQLLNQGRGNQKEDEFERLDQTISKLFHLIHHLKLPNRIELFVDDLQWIDEIIAEYILRLQNRTDFQVRTLSTARISDSESSIKSWNEKPEDNKHRLKLFQKLGYKAENQWDPTCCLRVKPLDRQEIAQLIETVLTTSSKSLSDTLAQEASIFLDPDVNGSLSSLFTVETLNLLSDKNLYEDLVEIEPVFKFEEGKVEFVERTPEVLHQDLKQIFSHLIERYQESFDLGQGGFNLSSYAVMEERLRLVEQHLGKLYAHLLVFSHLTGAPFEPKLIEQFIWALAENQELDASFKTEMVKACEQIQNHRLETLEDIYLLVDELERPKRHLIYRHRHRLVEVFAGAAFKRTINKYVSGSFEEKPNKLEYSIRKVFHEVVGDYLSKEFEGYNNKKIVKKELKRWQYLLISRMLNSSILFKFNPDFWAREYLLSIESLAKTYYKIPSDADVSYIWSFSKKNFAPIMLYEEAQYSFKELFEENPKKWALDYVSFLYKLAYSHLRKSDIISIDNEAIDIYLEAREIVKNFYIKNPKKWAEQYIVSLFNLANAYEGMGLLYESVITMEEILEVYRYLYLIAPEKCVEDYVECLLGCARIYYDIQDYERSKLHSEEALEVLRGGCLSSKEKCVERYIETLKILADSKFKIKSDITFVGNYEERLKLVGEQYLKNKYKWENSYVDALIDLAKSKVDNQFVNQNKKLIDKALIIIRKRYEDSPGKYLSSYVRNLESIYNIYLMFGQYQYFFDISEELLSTLRSSFFSSEGTWAEEYLKCLDRTASVYSQLEKHDDATRLWEKTLEPLRYLCLNNVDLFGPGKWPEVYIDRLQFLANIYFQKNNNEKVMDLQEQSIISLRKLYQENPDRWSDEYVKMLAFLISDYELYGNISKAEDLKEELSNI